MKSYRDIAGDGGSRVAEQVGERAAAIERGLAGVRHVVAVGSGKGGVGKSTVVALLASAWRAEGRRVAILDADINGPSQARLGALGAGALVPDVDGRLEPARTRAGVHVVSAGALWPESQAVGFDPRAAAGDSHLWRAAREFTFLGELLGTVRWGTIDHLLVDLPPGAERTYQHAEFLGPRASFVVVTIPSELARGVVARSVAALRQAGSRILGYVENMTGYACPGCDELRPLFPIAADPALDLRRLGSLPFVPELAAACDRGLGELPARVRAAATAIAREVDAGLEDPR
jgi:ATP-binding protein involved in chromosome partitioning